MAYTTIDKPSDYFNTKLYTGDASSSRDITGVGFQPDFTWIKDRDGGFSHILGNVVSGNNKFLVSSASSAESTDSTKFRTFVSDGFQVGNHNGVNANSNNYASWNWKANGAGVANTDGSISSTVSANTTSGFSIVSYTGNGGSTPKTVGHGLGVAPKMIIIKPRNLTYDWMTYNENVGATKGMCLNTTQAPFTSSNFNDTAPTTSVFSVKNNATNETNGTYIAYCFAEKQGYSKFGSYTGNGNADGTFVYTGFKPAFVLIKKSNSNGTSWIIFDNKRLGYNGSNYTLAPDNANDEATGDNGSIDLLSNGFKCRDTDSGANASGDTYIYMAFAESPFVTSTGVPATAR